LDRHHFARHDAFYPGKIGSFISGPGSHERPRDVYTVKTLPHRSMASYSGGQRRKNDGVASLSVKERSLSGKIASEDKLSLARREDRESIISQHMLEAALAPFSPTEAKDCGIRQSAGFLGGQR
jgi:hypothetical protein